MGVPGWSQEATGRSFEGNVDLLCNNSKPLFKKTQGGEPQCMQDSSSGKWVIERDLRIPRLLDHQPTFDARFLSITPAPDLLGVRGSTNYVSLPFPSLFLSLSLCISSSVCPHLSLFRSLSLAFLLSHCLCISSVAATISPAPHYLTPVPHSPPHSELYHHTPLLSPFYTPSLIPWDTTPNPISL